jgi:copper chaperone CopZ
VIKLFGAKNKGKQIELVVRGMSCNHCVMRVTKALQSVPGVLDAEVSLERGQAVVTVGPDQEVSQEALVAAVQKAGYEAEPVTE